MAYGVDPIIQDNFVSEIWDVHVEGLGGAHAWIWCMYIWANLDSATSLYVTC